MVSDFWTQLNVPLLLLENVKAVVVIMSKNCPVAQSPKGGDHALLQYVTVYVGIHGSLNELWLPSAGSTHAAPDHDTPTTMLDWRQNTLVFCTPHLVAATHAWHHLNKISLCWSHQTTGHGSSNPNCLRAFLCIIFRRGFLLGQQPCRPIDAVWVIWSENWENAFLS